LKHCHAPRGPFGEGTQYNYMEVFNIFFAWSYFGVIYIIGMMRVYSHDEGIAMLLVLIMTLETFTNESIIYFIVATLNVFFLKMKVLLLCFMVNVNHSWWMGALCEIWLVK